MSDESSPVRAEKPSSTAIAEHDLTTIRQMYGEVQNWARHYEGLIVNANVLVVSAGLIFVGLAFGEHSRVDETLILLVIPILFGVAGIGLTETLFRLYRLCIERLIRIEGILGCYDQGKMDGVDGLGPLVPRVFQAIPVRRPISVVFFVGLHSVLVATYVVLAVVKSL